MSHDSVLIVDFGSQVTQLIARRVREAGVYCEIHPFSKAAEAFARLKPKAAILSGGPASVPEPGSPRAPEEIFKSGVPILAICYGQQTLCEQLGGRSNAGMRRNSAGRMSRSSRPAPCSRACGERAGAIQSG
jgi:GMP synthase (glutamine-hydrolysing)